MWFDLPRRRLAMLIVPFALVSCQTMAPATSSSVASVTAAMSSSTVTTSVTSTTVAAAAVTSTTTTTTPVATVVSVDVESSDDSDDGDGGGLDLTSESIGEIASDSPDPTLAEDDGVYLAYTTNATDPTTRRRLNIPVRASFDLVHWTDAVDALPVLPSWASAGYTWAPTVRRLGDVWVMYFTARDRTTDLRCIGLATSSDANGPFVSASDEPVECQTDRGGSIDPEIFVADDGTAWLLWKNDGNCCAKQTSLWAAPIGVYGQITAEPTKLLSATKSWQHGVIENPTVIETSTGFVLLYSGGVWTDSSYGTGFALCSSLLEPCVNASGQPAFEDLDGTYGSGGLSVTTLDDGRIVAIWHAWTRGEKSTGRTARIAELSVG